MRGAILHILGAAPVLLATLGLAMAQSDYPSRLIRILVFGYYSHRILR